MNRFLCTILTGLTFALVLPPTSWAVPMSGGPHLWLSTDPTTFDEGGTGYIGPNTDPWLTDSYLTNTNPFMLYIYNAAQNKGTATDIQLLLAIHEGESGSITVGSTTYTSVTNTLLPAQYGGGSHGVYNDPISNGHDGRYTLTNVLGDLAPLTSISVPISWTGFSQIHVDVISSNGFYNPASHDATGGSSVPEPSSILLFGSGLAGFAAWRYRKGRMQ